MNHSNGDASLFVDDESSQIPFVYNYDNVVTFDGGGAYLGIVIAAPLEADHRSMCRLEAKLYYYLESFFSDYGGRNWKTPKDGKMRIYITIPTASSPVAFDVIAKFQEVASRRGVDLNVSTTD